MGSNLLKEYRNSFKKELEERLFWEIAANGLQAPQREKRFHDTRKWRFDFAYELRNGARLGIEVEGGIYAFGAHVRGNHYESDCEKYNEACLLGWDILRFTKNQIKTGYALSTIKRWLEKNA